MPFNRNEPNNDDGTTFYSDVTTYSDTDLENGTIFVPIDRSFNVAFTQVVTAESVTVRTQNTDVDVAGMNITTVQADLAVSTLGVPAATVDIGKTVSQSDLDDVVSAIDTAISTVNTKRAHLGAVSNRFDHIMENLQNVISHTVRSKGIMIEADLSIETTKLTKTSVLQQGATSMLAQANAQKNLVLSLFQ